ncbi:periplasmic fimbrial chaperone [Buttiauxella brennerae ATCC 51605]|uniref:Periplasmic fimbrial chaperone n=1 Tax=Buttiauxella brennerae ATCC 51605 TaxID=1354251 RepID=A0A1B7INK9_9ENTR|nr:fimbria/pilus periplasmic chaperone [Buttiauxella brennerae]OAT31260.1 periplasmic fimbrial chaperone [Buttiauxella brennerae ATCC 51605]
MNKQRVVSFLLLAGMAVSSQSYAAISMDRTRVIFNGDQKALSLNIENQNQHLPYLAQAWIEDDKGQKIDGPLTILPPVQRVEPGAKSQVKIQTLAGINTLPQDRETLYYFNLREIPPRSEKPNVLQLALQTRVKMFYRPAAIIPKKDDIASAWQNDLTLTKQGDGYKVTNPSAYYVTLVDARASSASTGNKFKPVMIAPKSTAMLGAANLGSTPVITYINDYGGRPTLHFACSGSECKVTANKVE